MPKKILKGVVVSDKMDKSAVVSVLEVKKIKKYHKSYTINKSYIVKDLANKAKKGDNITIIETKPFSKNGKWEILKQKNNKTKK